MSDILEPDMPAATPPQSIYWSGLDFATSIDPLPARRLMSGPPRLDAVLVGAGSVGGAGIYSFARTRGLVGQLEVVDPQTLTDTNPDRALLATAQVSAAGNAKADVAEAALEHLELVAEGHAMTVDQFVATRRSEETLPLVLCAVDSRQSRRVIQDCLPLDVINAACDPTNSVVSGHRTGSGPCVMCLFMASILDGEQALARLIVKQVPMLNVKQVGYYMAMRVPLEKQLLREIEQARDMEEDALSDYAGKTLRELWHGELVYGGVRAETGSGAVVAVAAPWITALAGFLLAGEAIKAGDAELAPFRLGPYVPGAEVHYQESPYSSPQFGLLTRPPRWTGEQCLCNSSRRRRLIIARYGLAEDEYPI
jgi:hypothetical protein